MEFAAFLMFICLCLALLLGYPVAFSLSGTALIFAGVGYFFGVFDITFLYALTQRLFGIMGNEVLLAVPLFILMGNILEKSKVANVLLHTMSKLFGSLRGGLGFSVIIVGTLLAASTGIVGATVVTLGLLSLPTMMKNGYSNSLSCGSICAAGTLGQIIPPSIVLVLLGDQLSNAYQQAQLSLGNFSPDTISVGDLFAGSLIPGLLLVILYLLYLIGVAYFRPETSPSHRYEEGEDKQIRFWQLVSILAPPLLLIIAVLGSILMGIATPTESAAVGCVGAVLLAGKNLLPSKGSNSYTFGILAIIANFVLAFFFDLRITRDEIEIHNILAIALAFGMSAYVFYALFNCLRIIHKAGLLFDAMKASTNSTCMVFLILIGASLFSLVFRGYGGDVYIEGFLSDLPVSTYGSVLLVLLFMFFLGFFLDFIEIIFVIVPLVAPILLQMTMPDGSTMSPVWLGVLMAMVLQTSFLTPPFGFALFYLRGVAPDSIRTAEIYWGVVPFIILQLLAVGILIYFHEIPDWLPSLLYD